MSEDSAQEKTEEATPRRKEKAREDGQIPRSKELTTSAVLILGTLGLWMFGGWMAESMLRVLRFNFDVSREVIFDPQKMFAQLASSFYDALLSLVPLFGVLMLAALLAPIALGGWMFSSKSLAPKLNRMDPIAGLKRMFSVKSLVELAKAIAKVVLVVGVAFATLSMFQDNLLNLGRQALEGAMGDALSLALWSAILISASTIVIAVVDIPFQIWDYSKKMKMSMQEIKDEMKETEGKPEVKGRMRQMQREMANQRMMAAVPEADVVITNPTHYAVALKYNPETMETPILLAKGIDHAAFRIRDLAREHKIELVRSPVLARAVYHTTELEGEIPGGLYLAVAQVLAYVFQLRNFRNGHGERPGFPNNLNIPKDMIFPER